MNGKSKTQMLKIPNPFQLSIRVLSFYILKSEHVMTEWSSIGFKIFHIYLYKRRKLIRINTCKLFTICSFVGFIIISILPNKIRRFI